MGKIALFKLIPVMVTLAVFANRHHAWSCDKEPSSEKDPGCVNRTSYSAPIHRPGETEIAAIAEKLGLHLEAESLASFQKLVDANLKPYDVLAKLPDNLPVPIYLRTPGYSPRPSENLYGAWYWKTKVIGEPSGKLQGRTVVLKDNVCLAGVPMMNGCITLEGYVPELDATVATRILQAGGTIIGKAHCESLCLSGGSHTNSKGPVINPHKENYSSGGSSSGSAVLVSIGEADMAIGGDQGGSIRIPSSFCGIYGMKPTHGLVPYTGIMPIEMTLDHAGPMTNTVADNALLLEVIAGRDGLDPRQYFQPERMDYTSSLEKGVKGLKIGIVQEGFEQEGHEDVVNIAVREAANTFAKLGAEIHATSIPEHKTLGPTLFTAIAVEGSLQTMMKGNGFGVGWEGLYLPSLMKAHAQWRQRSDDLSETLKLFMILGEHLNKQYGGGFYAKAQNLRRELRAAYDEKLKAYDLLLMPTTPMRATPLPRQDSSREEYIKRALEMILNTCPFDVSGHPAMNIPCGKSEGLPIGLMLIGKHFDESTIYQAAACFEKNVEWKTVSF